MELKPIMFLIACPLCFLAGFVDSIGGGGGLISIPAYLFAGLPAHLAVATNKFSACLGTAVSTGRYIKNKCVDWGAAIPGIAASFLGAQLGARLALMVSDKVFRVVLLVLLPLLAVYMLLRKNLEPDPGKSVPRKKQLILVAVTTLIIGVYDGFYGPGTGTFLLLVYTALCGMTVRNAGGNMKLANLASNISSLTVFLMKGVVLLPLGLAAGLCSIAGNWLGSGLAIKNGARLVRWVMLGVLVLLFVKVIIEAIG